MISKTVACIVHQVITDPGGRYAIVVADICMHKMVLVNVYVPPPFQIQVLHDLLGRLAPFMHLPLIVAGDFNAILNATLDSSNSRRVASVELSAWAETAALTKLWRWKNPNTRSFSHLSKMHKSPSRIDLAFANASMLELVRGANYIAGGCRITRPYGYILACPCRLGGCNMGWLEVESVASQVAPVFLVTGKTTFSQPPCL